MTVTNANGCSDTASLTVLVPYVVTPGNITAPGDTNICPGEDQPEIASASLGTAAGASATATVTYQWQYKVGQPRGKILLVKQILSSCGNI